MSRLLDLSGQTFGLLSPLRRIGNLGNKVRWLCLCSCGKEVSVTTDSLRSGNTTSCGCIKTESARKARFVDHSGETHGNWTIGRFVGYKKVNRRTRMPNYSGQWECYCRCGGTKILPYSRVIEKSHLTCGCATNLSPIDVGRRRVFAAYKAAAKRRNIWWDLTIEQASKLFESKCYYCGSLPKSVSKPQGKFKKTKYPYLYNGIDRVNNDDHYNVINTVSCCKRCNFAKGQLSYHEFIEQVQKIFRNRVEICSHADVDSIKLPRWMVDTISSYCLEEN